MTPLGSSPQASPNASPPPAGTALLQLYVRPESLIFLGLWLFLLFIGREGLFGDPGTFWHTMVGERLLASRQFPHPDPFSFTVPATQAYVPFQWLGECLMALVHRLDGLDSLLLATATLLAALYAWLAQRLMRAGLHWSAAAPLAALALAASAVNLHIRPLVATLLFLAVTLAWLSDFEAGRVRWTRLLWLVPVYLVWSNIHGGVVGGLGTMGLAVAGWGLYWLLGKDSPIGSFRQFLLLVALIVGCGSTAFINPYGAEVPRSWLAILRSPLLTEHIQEHAPLHLERPETWPALVLACLYSVVLLSVGPRWPRVTWLVPLVWLFLAFMRIRHVPLFAIAATLALGELLPFSRIFQRWADTGSDLFQPSAARPAFDRRALLLPFLAVGTALLLQAAGLRVPLIGHGWARLDPDRWPVELLPELKEVERTQGEGTPIFNEDRQGGFLIYHAPHLRVLIDDRWELYGDERVGEYAAARTEHTAEAIERWERRWPFGWALTEIGSRFDDYFRAAPDWIVVKRTATAALYRKKTLGR